MRPDLKDAALPSKYSFTDASEQAKYVDKRRVRTPVRAFRAR